MITKIRKRNDDIVEFNPDLIQKAIFAAAKSVGGRDVTRAKELTNYVIDELNKFYQYRIPSVEEIQDEVEKVLIEHGHAKTAKAYILYRAKQAVIREEQQKQILEKIKKHEAVVTLQDGTTAEFNIDLIFNSVSVAAQGLPKVDVESVVLSACKHLYSGVTIPEIETAVINSARSKIEEHPQYSQLASKLLLQKLYKGVFGKSVHENYSEVDGFYRENFEKYIHFGIEDSQLDPRLKEFDLSILSKALIPDRDHFFEYRGLQTLADRYLLKTVEKPQRIFELPQYLWMRVVMGIALAEKPEDRTQKAMEFYHIVSRMDYVPSTPTLFNSGTTHPQLSSCFLNTTPDTLEGIFKTYSDNAMLSKWAGGLGTDWTPVRSLGSKIHGTNGDSQGIIPFLKIFNDVAIAVNQGGKRKGAMCAYLEAWHGDIEEFLESKKNTGDERRRLHDIHTAVWLPDLFMKRVEEKGTWTLFSPSEVPELHETYGRDFEQKYLEYENKGLPSARQIDATSLWRKMLTMLYETGHPWITFKDPANVRNPQDHAGVIHNSNLCTEITLNTSGDETAVCNLGSLNLSHMISNGVLDEEKLKHTVQTAVRMLDNVIDINFYPTKEARKSNQAHRPIGLGLMGYQDALYKQGIRFDSEENLQFADRSMEMISYHAISASADLAKEKGAYESYDGSKWSKGIFPYDSMALLEEERGGNVDWDTSQSMDWTPIKEKVKTSGMRNSNCMAIAPTATISNISGTVPCTEPSFRNIYVKENTDGSFIVVNESLVEKLEKLGLWDQDMINKIKYYNGSISKIYEIPEDIRALYKEAFEIEPEWILKGASRRAKWIDQSASTNIFLSTTNGKVLHETYMNAWKLGLKTTYYLRSQSVSSVEKTSSQIDESTQAQVNENVDEPKVCSLDDPDCEVCQ